MREVYAGDTVSILMRCLLCELILEGRPTVTREEWNEHLTQYIKTCQKTEELEERLRQAEIGINKLCTGTTHFGQEWDKNLTLPAKACHDPEALMERLQRVESALKELWTANLGSHCTTHDPAMHSDRMTFIS